MAPYGRPRLLPHRHRPPYRLQRPERGAGRPRLPAKLPGAHDGALPPTPLGRRCRRRRHHGLRLLPLGSSAERTAPRQSHQLLPRSLGLGARHASLRRGRPQALERHRRRQHSDRDVFRSRPSQRTVHRPGVPRPVPHPQGCRGRTPQSAPRSGQSLPAAAARMANRRGAVLRHLAAHALCPAASASGPLRQHRQLEPLLARELLCRRRVLALPRAASAVDPRRRLRCRCRGAGAPPAGMARVARHLHAARIRRLPVRGRGLHAAHFPCWLLVQRPLPHPLLRRDIPRARGRHGPCRHRRLRSEES